jgi:catechol 2,3-dioxygenase-like lactoylglutathione lyase family enzyme
MIDHLALHVSDLGAAKALILPALAPLGYTEGPSPAPGICGLVAPAPPGAPGPVADLWLYERPDAVTQGHVALTARDRAAVDAFHAAALAAGAADHGAPGERPYHPGYYSAYVRTPDGVNLEAVCHVPG